MVQGNFLIPIIMPGDVYPTGGDAHIVIYKIEQNGMVRLLDPNPKNVAVEGSYLGVGEAIRDQLQIWGLIMAGGGGV